MGARRPRANQEAYTLNRSRAVLRRSKLDDGTGPHLLPRPREYKVGHSALPLQDQTSGVRNLRSVRRNPRPPCLWPKPLILSRFHFSHCSLP
jgi:hypothetical protein